MLSRSSGALWWGYNGAVAFSKFLILDERKKPNTKSALQDTVSAEM